MNLTESTLRNALANRPRSKTTSDSAEVKEAPGPAEPAIQAIQRRAEELFQERQGAIHVSTDRLLAGLMAFQAIAAVLVALIISPRTWEGASSRIHPHLWLAVMVGSTTASLPIALALSHPGRAVTRQVMAVSQILIGALLIHLTGGRIETHFHVFGSLAILSFYRDWRVLLTATAVVVADHCFRGYFWPRSIYGVITIQPFRWFEHSGWVIAEVYFLIWSCCRSQAEMRSIADHQAVLESLHEQSKSEVEQRSAELRDSQALNGIIIETANDAIVTLDRDWRVLDHNPAAEVLFQLPRNQARGRKLTDFLLRPETSVKARGISARRSAGPRQLPLGRRIELEAVDAQGHRFPVEVTINQVDREGEPLYAMFVRDITERRRHQLQLERQARLDPLTNLPNRTAFQERLEQMLRRSASLNGAPPRLAMLLIDLNRFKEINDTLGHHIGDRVLRRIRPRLTEVVEEPGLVARLGGDEFGVLLPGADEAQATKIAEELLLHIKPPILEDGHILELDASIGLVLAPDHGDDPFVLMQHADVAMYTAKRGHVGYLVFEPNQSPYTPDRLALIGELRRAIEADELVLYYQPKVDLRSMTLNGAEALVRWPHPREGMLSPNRFIPLAEQAGLVRPLGLWSVRTALVQCQLWNRHGRALHVAVNFSAENLIDPNVAQMVMKDLEETETRPEWLTIEVTEGVMMADPKRSRETLETLRNLGVRISIDDFGTGYSSLGYLRDLPVDEVKIDRTFIRNILHDHYNRSITRTVVELARNLGLKVVAEGVEDRETLDYLIEIGCDSAQGYVFCRPIPGPQLAERIEQGRLDWNDNGDLAHVKEMPQLTSNSR